MKNSPKRPASAPTRPASPTLAASEPSAVSLADRHFRFGWWSLTLFLTLGIILETLHGFKIGAYLNVSNSTRRLLWTLAHAHGTLFGVLNILFSGALQRLPEWGPKPRKIASAGLIAATWLLPGGFFLGGFGIHGGDPGLGIFLVPPGALLALVAVFSTAAAASRLNANS